ncbi:hypothetical protein EHQ76_14875 [Leptospira barantonii]|uniref:Uncharacterized protein n=1 Tax=Leptospira barantonii TaxID=2023184 RepID=A0A5F2B0D7_9LEPT|nr:hypothetical protein [Leptospira barantonii]TGL97416.1 hypothetical protein EHQ76_14875 [Leptospira barantonii]
MTYLRTSGIGFTIGFGMERKTSLEKSETSEDEFGISEWIKALQYILASGFFSGIVWTDSDLKSILHPIFYYATFPLPGIGFCFVFYLILKWFPNRNFPFVSFSILTNLLFLFSVFFFVFLNHLVEQSFYGRIDSNFLEQNIVFSKFWILFLCLAVSSFLEIKIIEHTTGFNLQIRYILFIALISGLLAVAVFFENIDWVQESSDFFRLKKEENSDFYESNVLSIRFACFVWTIIHGCLAVVLIWVWDDKSDSEPEFLPISSDS